MSKSRYPFESDEFDAPPPGGAPVGVHRSPRGAWSKTWPFLLVAVIFAGLALGAVWTLGRYGGGSGGEATDKTTTSAPPRTTKTTDAPSPSTPASPDTPSTPATSTAPAVDVNRAATVRVLNDTGTEGVAANAAQSLEEAGYTAVTADNYSGPKLTENTVYYAAAEFESTARDIAAKFGISAVQLVNPLRANVSVILVSKP